MQADRFVHLTLLLGLMGHSGAGAVLNVDFNLGATPTFAGLGVAPDAAPNPTWNGLALTGSSAPGTVNAFSAFNNLVFSDGSASGVGLTIRRTSQSDIPGGVQTSGNSAADLLRDYATVNSGNSATRLAGTLTLTGLPEGCVCDLYLFGAGSQAEYRTEFTVNDVSRRTTGPSAATSSLTEWEDYVRFTGIQPNATNAIVIQFANITTGPAPSAIAPVNGLQLVITTVAPRPWLWIESTDAATVRLSWSTNAPGFILEQTELLPALHWTAVTNAVAVVGQDYSVTTEVSSGQRFFRLRKN